MSWAQGWLEDSPQLQEKTCKRHGKDLTYSVSERAELMYYYYCFYSWRIARTRRYWYRALSWRTAGIRRHVVVYVEYIHIHRDIVMISATDTSPDRKDAGQGHICVATESYMVFTTNGTWLNTKKRILKPMNLFPVYLTIHRWHGELIGRVKFRYIK